jgi:AbiV family abortive infection protein
MPKELTFDQLADGYKKTIVTAHRLMLAAMNLLEEYPEISLGLAELGQEEIGKSLSILSAFQFESKSANWKWFWSGWKNHQLKAHRAYLYELIYPLRINRIQKDGSSVSLLGTRSKISQEREWSFYVNFDSTTSTFQSPEENIMEIESANRIITLLYLATTARSVGLCLEELGTRSAYKALSEVALRICSTNLNQQNMTSVFGEFQHRSSENAEILASLRKHLEEGRKSLAKYTRRESTQAAEYP